MSECLFCKIVKGIVPAEKIYEDENILAFYDISPKAETHALVIPKKHIISLDDLKEEDRQLLGGLTLNLPKIAKMLNLTNGYRTIINTGKGGGQVIFHLHYHILGGPRLPGF